MNRMNRSMGCCMPPANGCKTPGRNPEGAEKRKQIICPPDPGKHSEEIFSDLPVGNRRALLNFINEEGFASYEAILYLDTHPDDPGAGDYFRLHNRRYREAVKEYSRLYAPLTIDTASSSPSEIWNWMQQPWPWEGGDC